MSRGASSLLITGASGFVGSHLVEMALDEGYEVWAAVRKTSPRTYLADARIHLIELDLNDADTLQHQLYIYKVENGGRGWDYVVHAAGATKARNEAGFMQSNYEATRNLATALSDLEMRPVRFVLMSSLSAVPMRNGWPAGGEAETAYGRSKLEAEKFIMTSGLDYVILRPTGVYGPRERDYFLMARSISRHLDFAVGFRPQHLTFIYVRDLCTATLLALTRGRSGRTYQLSDGNTYSSRDFSRLLRKYMGVGMVVRLTVPLWLLRAACHAGEWFSRLTHRMTAINRDKYNILKQRDWRCNTDAAKEDLGFSAAYGLERGVAETIAWYKKEKWI